MADHECGEKDRQAKWGGSFVMVSTRGPDDRAMASRGAARSDLPK